MSHKFYSLLFFLFTVISSCDFPGVFSESDSQQALNEKNAAAGDTILVVQITGGFAGVEQELIVYGAGRAYYVDSLHPGKSWEVELGESVVDSLNILMEINHFFRLQDEYIAPNVADAFLYTITYSPKGRTKTVTTNNFSVPLDLETIVGDLIKLIDSVQNSAPGLELVLNKTEMRVGDIVEMTLLVSNLTANSLTLHFTDGQIFDFRVLRATDGQTFIWNWAYGKGFTLALWNLTLAPGESKSYQVIWNGTGNSGDAVVGMFSISAVLVSTPGGTTLQIPFSIVR